MLILRRKSGESIVIGENINVTVLDINEGSVRLAIDAPKAIPILRSELLQAADANRDSAAANHDSLRILSGKAGAAHPRAVRPRVVKPVKASEPANPAETGTPSEPANPTETGTPSEPANPTETGTASEPANPAETGTPSEPANPAETGTPSEPANPAETGTPSE